MLVVDDQVYYGATSRKNIYRMDGRMKKENEQWENDCMVNSIVSCLDGISILTGDSNGQLKTWDVRKGQCIPELTVSNGKHAISHVTACDVKGDAFRGFSEQNRFIAVNSYDNALRVYKWYCLENFILYKLVCSGPTLFQAKTDVANAPMKVVNYMAGIQMKNWPIKSSFFAGEGINFKYQHVLDSPLLEEDDDEFDEEGAPLSPIAAKSKLFDKNEEKSSNETKMLATGSADNNIYIYNVTYAQHDINRSSNNLIQKINAHNDRVYCVHFHPSEPIFASASADTTIKLWTPRKK